MPITQYSQTWNLDTIFPGGSESTEFQAHLQKLEYMISSLHNNLQITSIDTAKYINDFIKTSSDIKIHLSEASSFISCLVAQNTKDSQAVTLRGKIHSLQANYESYLQQFQKQLAGIDKQTWKSILNSTALTDFQFILNEWREKAKSNLSTKEIRITSDLMVDGYQAWEQFYQTMIGRIKIDVNQDLQQLSVGQTINLRSHPDEAIRKQSHLALEKIWQEEEGAFAKVYNHLTGFRIKLSAKKGNENILEESLLNNRMSVKTLDAMWATISKHKQPFVDYLNQKAKLSGYEKMKMHNFWSPIATHSQHIPYDDAVNFLLQQYRIFGTELETFATNAFKNRWIEAENRPGKSPVAFCAGFSLSKESRIFATYNESITNVLSFAHELGHAFHNYAMKDVNVLNKQYPLSIAETASTFSEMIILDGAIENAASKEERVFLLDEKLKRCVMNFMQMHARFLFESNFYEERKKGYVPASKLNDLMRGAYEVAYAGSIENYSEHTWLWTPHYYITGKPFYNFPYTFGFLFTLCIYAKAKEKGEDFEKEYLALLRDSGSMSTEELVMKHLNEDTTSEKFWEKGLTICMEDVREFINLTSADI